MVVLVAVLATAVLPACTKSKDDDAARAKRKPAATATRSASVSPTKATVVEKPKG